MHYPKPARAKREYLLKVMITGANTHSLSFILTGKNGVKKEEEEDI